MIINLKDFCYTAQTRIVPKYGIVFDAPERHQKYIWNQRVGQFDFEPSYLANVVSEIFLIFFRENVIYYPFKFGTSEIAYFSSSCFRLSCAFSISVIRTFLNAALIEKKQRNRKKKKHRDKNQFPMPFSSHENGPVFWSLKNAILKHSISMCVLWPQNISHILGSKKVPKFDALN